MKFAEVGAKSLNPESLKSLTYGLIALKVNVKFNFGKAFMVPAFPVEPSAIEFHGMQYIWIYPDN